MIFKLLAILCIAGAVGLIGYEQMFSGRAEAIDQAVNPTISSDDKINYRLQSIDQKIKIQKLEAMKAQDNEHITGAIESDERNHEVRMIKGIDERLDSTLQDVISDLTPANKQESLQKLEDEIQDGLQALEDVEDYNEAERDAFIRAFIENARAKGLEIKIDKDLNVYE